MTLSQLSDHLHSDEVACRQRAAYQIGESASEQAVELLLAALEQEHNFHVRWVIVYALGRTGQKRALDRLQTVLDDDHEHSHVRYQASQAILRLNGQPHAPDSSLIPQAWVTVVAVPHRPVEIDPLRAPVENLVTEYSLSLSEMVTSLRNHTASQESLPHSAPRRRWPALQQLSERRMQRQIEQRLKTCCEPVSTPELLDPSDPLAAKLAELLLPGMLTPQVMAAIDHLRGRAESAKLSLEQAHATVQPILDTLQRQINLPSLGPRCERMLAELQDEFDGLGPLTPLMKDQTVPLIMINGPKDIYIERHGNYLKTQLGFDDQDHLRHILTRLLAPAGIRLSAQHSVIRARLADDTLVHVVMPPAAAGPTITIQKPWANKHTAQDMIHAGEITPEITEFLRACVIAQINIMVYGEEESDRAVLVNLLAQFIPSDERIVALENRRWLRFEQPHIVQLEASDEMPFGTLLDQLTLLKAKRLIISDCQGHETLRMLQTIQSSPDGVITSIFAPGSRNVITQLQFLCRQSDPSLTERAIRDLISSSANLVIHFDRLQDGRRKVLLVAELSRSTGEYIELSPIYQFEQTGIEAGKVIGRIRPTGSKPRFMNRFAQFGIRLPPSLFGIGLGRY